MIKFLIFPHKDILFSGEAQYLNQENSFFYKPWNDVDFSIIIGNGYNSLDVNLETRKIVQLTGLNPKNNWIKKNIIIPTAQPGSLMVLLNDNYPAGTGIQYATNWQTYFNVNTGWICIGYPDYFNNSEAVMFADNTIAVITNNDLCSVWIKPRFV